MFAIDPVPHYGASQKCHMDADLVCPSGQWVDFEQGMGRETFQRTVLADRLTTLFQRNDSHQFTVGGIPPDWGFDAPCWRGWFPIHQRQVKFLHDASSELVLKPSMRPFIFCHNDQTRGFFIQPVDNSRAFLAAYPFHLGRVSKRGMDESPAVVTRRRVHHHPGGFIHHKQIIVLENNIQRDILSHQAAGDWRGDPDFDFLARFQIPPCFRNRTSIHSHEAAFY